MFINQNKLEAYFSSQHLRSPSLKVAPPATQGRPTPGDEPEEEAITPAPDESERTASPDAGEQAPNNITNVHVEFPKKDHAGRYKCGICGQGNATKAQYSKITK